MNELIVPERGLELAERLLANLDKEAELVKLNAEVEKLRALMGRMANTIEAQNALIENHAEERSNLLDSLRFQADYIETLCNAGWDVLPTLELYWKGERPIPEWHPTAVLRAVLEENK